MKAIALKRVPIKHPFEAYLLSVSQFPIPVEESGAIKQFVNEFCASASARYGLTSEEFMQLEQLRGKECRELFADHGRDWMPQTGLGVWVDRVPPEKWTQEELDNASPERKLRPLMFQAFRISTDQQRRGDARSTMLRYGSVMEILTSTGEGYLPRVKPRLVSRITDRIYSCFPFYVPLMECKTVAEAELDQLEYWFDGITVYVRESFEDQGILIASKEPLAPVFERIDASRHQFDRNWTGH